jgi:hypothetical protein
LRALRVDEEGCLQVDKLLILLFFQKIFIYFLWFADCGSDAGCYGSSSLY